MEVQIVNRFSIFLIDRVFKILAFHLHGIPLTWLVLAVEENFCLRRNQYIQKQFPLYKWNNNGLGAWF